MLTAARAITRAGEATPLPAVPELGALAASGATLRRGQLHMLAGFPQAGKSTLALWWLWRTGARTLFFSADTDSHDMIVRLGAMASGHDVNLVASALETGGEYLIRDALEGIPIQFCFDSGPTMTTIADELDAYVELWDAYPDAIVVDSAMNVESGSEDEHSGLRWIMKELHRLAHSTNTAVIVLHHCREEGSTTEPPARDKIQGKIAQLPELILTMAFDPYEQSLKIAPVKVRSGKPDPTARNYIRLSSQHEMATFTAYVPRGWSQQ